MTTKAELIAWLKRPDSIRVVLVEISSVLDEVGNTKTFYLSDKPYTTRPTDSPANVSYTAAIIGGVSFSENVSLDGAASISSGDIELDNTDNSRSGDSWLKYTWVNRPINIYLGDVTWSRADFYNIFSGAIKDIDSKNRNSVNLILVNNLDKLNKAISQTLIGGTGPNKDQLIPLTFGECFNVSPLLVNSVTRQYQVHNGPIEGFIEVRDNGAPLTGSSLPVYNTSTGTFTLTAQPAGTITATVQGSKKTGSTYQSKIGSIIADIITNYVDAESLVYSLDPTAATSSGTDNTIELTIPGNSADTGDRLIIVVGLYDSNRARTLATPTQQGTWSSLITDSYPSGENGILYVFDRELTAPLTTLNALTATGTAGVWLASVIKCRGDRTVAVTTQSNGFSTNFQIPAITATSDNSTLIRLGFARNWPRSFTSPHTELFDFNGGSNLALVGAWTRVNTGAQATQNFVADTGDVSRTVSIILEGTATGGGGGGGGGGGETSTVLGGTINGTTVNISTPAAVSGDILFIGINYQNGTSITATTPSGWTIAEDVSGFSGGDGPTKGRAIVYYKAITSTTNADSLTLTFSATVTGAYISSKHTGTFRTSASGYGEFSTNFVAPTVTATSNNSTLLTWVGPGHYTRTHTPPTGTTELLDQTGGGTNGPSIALGIRSVGNGTTGTTVWTPNLGEDYQAISVIIDDNAGAGGGGSGGGGGGGGTGSASFYVGSHVHGYGTSDRYASGTYTGSTNTMEPFNFGSIRWHDNEGFGLMSHWTGRTGGINATGDGINQYSWTNVDTMTDKMFARGHAPFLWCVFGCPTWASRRPSDASVYGDGVTSWTSNPTAYRQAVRDTLLRIRQRHGAGVIGWVECWNEPIGGGDNYSTGQFLNAVGYTAGSGDPQTTMYADICQTIYNGVRDAGTTYSEFLTCPVLIGAHTYEKYNETRARLMNAKTSGGVAITAIGTNLAWSFHPYGFSDANPALNLTNLTAQLRQWAAEVGTSSWDFYNTEWGTYMPWNPSSDAWWQSIGNTERNQATYDAIARYKALGWRGVWTYSNDASPNPGNLSFLNEPERNAGARTALNTAYATFNGGLAGPVGQNASLWTRTFTEEFTGSSLDTTKWNTSIWYGDYNQQYAVTNYDVNNGSNSCLRIWPALGSNSQFFDRTIDTDGKFQQQYGFFEARMKLPIGVGIWPAFWIFAHPDNLRPEIDIMEAYPGGGPSTGWSTSSYQPDNYGATLHLRNGTGGEILGSEGPFKLNEYLTTQRLDNSFNVYGCEWDATTIKFYFNGSLLVSRPYALPYQMYVLLDLWMGSAPGRSLPGGPPVTNNDSITPKGSTNSFEIDYVRVWQKI